MNRQQRRQEARKTAKQKMKTGCDETLRNSGLNFDSMQTPQDELDKMELNWEFLKLKSLNEPQMNLIECAEILHFYDKSKTRAEWYNELWCTLMSNPFSHVWVACGAFTTNFLVEDSISVKSYRDIYRGDDDIDDIVGKIHIDRIEN